MALDAKAELMKEMERGLAKEITADAMAKVMNILADQLAGYNVEKNDADEGRDDYMSAYIDALTVEGKSPKTVERYRYILSRVMRVVKTDTRKITVYHLRKYLSDEKARGISDRTLEGIRQVLSSYFNWLQRENMIQKNPCANLGTIKYAKKQKDIYTDVDMERMKFACKTLRDRAIIHFLKATGCRISEMTALNRTDVDFTNRECTVLGKGNKERTVYLDQVSAMVLREYLTNRTDHSPALFAGKGSDRMKPGGIRKMLVQLGMNANVSHVHPHKFRRTMATSLIRHGMPIQEVAAILGHDKIDTTMQYVVLDKTDIKAAYQRYA